jgi:tetratricopeptide (TPR) repeat protein
MKIIPTSIHRWLISALISSGLIFLWVTPFPFWLRIKLAEKVGSDAMAIHVIDSALRWGPDNDDSVLVMAKLKLEYGERQLEQALGILNAQIEKHPNNYKLYKARSDVRRCLGDIEGALLDIKKAQKLVTLGIRPKDEPYPSDNWFSDSIKWMESMLPVHAEKH